MILTSTSPVCHACAATLGITGGFSGNNLILPDSASAGQVAAAEAFIASLPIAHNHAPLPNPVQIAATEVWLRMSQRLQALPPVPGSGPDTYATVRARLQADVDTAWAAVQTAGGPI